MSRIDSVFLALRKAKERAKGAVLSSDGFFPFADSIEAAAEAGDCRHYTAGWIEEGPRGHRSL